VAPRSKTARPSSPPESAPLSGRSPKKRARGVVASVGGVGGALGGSPLDALSAWRALVSGRWSVVDHFSLHGRRFLVARRSPSTSGTMGGLSRREFMVCVLVARGHSNKLVAIELDLASSTVATHLAHAMLKLGVSSRIELVRLFASIPRTKRVPRRAPVGARGGTG
jgi:DNA-binding CsgD family transcriptional regulator